MYVFRILNIKLKLNPTLIHLALLDASDKLIHGSSHTLTTMSKHVNTSFVTFSSPYQLYLPPSFTLFTLSTIIISRVGFPIMFAPPHHKKGQPPPTTRMMRHMAQTSLDAFQRRMSKSKPDEATASPKGHGSPGPTQTRRKPNGDGSPSPSPTGSTESDDVAPPPPHDTTKAMPKIHTVEEAQDCLLAAQLIEPEDPMDPDTLACSLM